MDTASATARSASPSAPGGRGALGDVREELGVMRKLRAETGLSLAPPAREACFRLIASSP